MCFNKETSISAFIIGSVFTILNIRKGTNKNDKFSLFIGLISIFIVIIQLLEYFIWSDITNVPFNNKVSLAIILITVFQPVIFLLIYSFVYKKPLPYWLIIFFIVYIVINKGLFTYNKNLITVIDKSKKLLWPNFENQGYVNILTPILYWLMIGVLVFKLYKINDNEMNILLKNVGIISIFTLFIVYLHRPKTFTTTKGIFSTLWCIFCIFIPIIAYIIR
jgi:hypothetical protein